MITLTNTFHRTSITLRKKEGDHVSPSTLSRARRALCGMAGCTCAGDDGTRESDFSLVPQGSGPDSPILVVANR